MSYALASVEQKAAVNCLGVRSVTTVTLIDKYRTDFSLKEVEGVGILFSRVNNHTGANRQQRSESSAKLVFDR